MDPETDKKKPETPYKFCATTFLAGAGILLGAASALFAFLGNNLSKVIALFVGDSLSIENKIIIITALGFFAIFAIAFLISIVAFTYCIKQYWKESFKAVNDYEIDLLIQRNKQWSGLNDTADEKTNRQEMFNKDDLDLARSLTNKAIILIDVLTEKIKDNTK